MDFKTKDIEVNGSKLNLHIWDSAGQERYRSIGHNYYRGVEGIIIMYDISDKESFENVRYWH